MTTETPCQVPLVTVVIATFNSASLLPRVLDALDAQTYPKDRIEVLLVDGGSSDNTRDLGQSRGCRIIDNPRTEPVYAKYLGYHEASGDYLVYLDHDEVLENPQSIAIKVSALQENPDLHAVIGSGYINPPGYPIVNEYINDYGDPFSFFIYRLPKSVSIFMTVMKSRYQSVKESLNYVVFDFSSAKSLPIIELCAAGSMIDLKWFVKEAPIRSPADIPHLFYSMLDKSVTLAMTKNDGLVHYSSETWRKYLNKIKWRVKNNIFHKQTLGASGFSGRNEFQPAAHRWKKYIYIPYVVLIIPVLLDAIQISISRRSWLYFAHLPLSMYTGAQIVKYLILRLIGYKSQLKSYDETTPVTGIWSSKTDMFDSNQKEK